MAHAGATQPDPSIRSIAAILRQIHPGDYRNMFTEPAPKGLVALKDRHKLYAAF
ncbi:hypothetical protein AGR4B_Cc50090 [Agrobacterium tumefaciens str. CFBP 5621]|nr:hypothetical protein AGR4B_Cc50090 [Agrobacterium tumefaciens str. CFBP 5621]